MDLLLKCLVSIVVTWGVRGLAVWSGPRWGGLLLGLPCSTALMLIFLGSDRGDEFAATAAHSGLLGLVGAMALTLGYCQLATRGCSVALLGGVAVYLSTAGMFWLWRPDAFAVVCALAVTGVLGAMWLAQRLTVPAQETPAAQSNWRAVVLRSAVPVVCVTTVTQLAETLGAVGSGLLSTFPATFVAVLVITHVESGARAASLLGRSFPQGNLSMIAFLGVFRWSCAEYGLAPGLAVGYGAAVGTLIALEAARHLRERLTLRDGFVLPECAAAAAS